MKTSTQKYIITCKTDAYTASFLCIYKKTVLAYEGNTLVKWIYDDNFGDGYSLNEARQILMDMAEDDHYEHGYPMEHELADDSYYHDVYTYRIEEAYQKEKRIVGPDGKSTIIQQGIEEII